MQRVCMHVVVRARMHVGCALVCVHAVGCACACMHAHGVHVRVCSFVHPRLCVRDPLTPPAPPPPLSTPFAASMTAGLYQEDVACIPLLAPRSAAVAYCDGAMQVSVGGPALSSGGIVYVRVWRGDRYRSVYARKLPSTPM